MTNAQSFSIPTFNIKVNEDLIDSNAVPNANEKEIIWESLLGKNTKELTSVVLATSVKFSSYIEKTRTEFNKNPKDLKKFPKMDAAYWK